MPPFAVKITPVPPVRVKEIRDAYARIGAARRNIRPAMEIIAVEMANVAKETFESQGRRGGGSWQFLSPERVHEKEREGLDPRILYATHRLFQSMTEIGSSENIVQIQKINPDDYSVALGTEVPYARVMWSGSSKRHIPARKFYKAIPTDRLRFVRILQQWFWDAYAAGPGETAKAPRGFFNI